MTEIVEPKITKQEMRILIARDVIALIRARRRINVTPGVYMSAKQEVSKKDIAKDVQLGKKLKKCEVCALGALFVAEVDRNDKLGCRVLVDTGHLNATSVGFSIDADFIRTRLSTYFADWQLNMIEGVFEEWPVTMSEEARDFWGRTYDHPDDRLMAIMHNIITNNGTFRPNEEPRQAQTYYVRSVLCDRQPCKLRHVHDHQRHMQTTSD